MTYEPKTWVCGETITADGLNNIEEGVQEALECCSGGGDCGYSCTESQELVFEGNLTTTDMGGICGASLTLSQPVDSDSIIVTFNGAEYELPKVEHGYGELNDGVPSFATYPCFVGINPYTGNMFFTPSAGTYSVKIEIVSETAETTKCFEKAVKKCGLKYVKDYSSDNGGVVENNVSENVAGEYAHAEGSNTTADNYGSHAEGYNTTASGSYSHAEGSNTTASGDYGSHAEGSNTTANGDYSHAEGYNTTASGNYSHAEGYNTTASGNGSHAEGANTTASNYNAHAEGEQTIANHRSQHVFGAYNIADPSTSTNRGNYIEIVGNGTNSNARSNARTLDWSGNEELQGSLTLGKGTADETTVTAAQLKALLALL